VLISEFTLGRETYQSFKCGHGFVKDQIEAVEADNLDFLSVDGTKKLREYQKIGVQFIIDSGYCCVLGDQMRLGKTPQAEIAVKNHPKFNDEDFCCLILCRAANMYQWVRETKCWCENNLSSVWVIQGTKNWIPPGFKFYICSMDTFGRKGMSDELLKFGFKLVIADEAHSFKNQSSQRSQALVSFLKNIERSELEQVWTFSCPFDGTQWDEKVTIKVDTLEAHKKTSKTSHCPVCYSQVQQSAAAHVKVTRNCGIVMLTGTAIKNRADEYYVPLNLIAPEKFPSIESFRRKWLMQDSKGKWSRVAPRAMDAFKREIAPFVLRREKEDVYQEVPKLQRIFTPVEINDERLKKAYNAVIDEMEIERAAKPNLTFFESIGHLQKLRRICGLSKVQFVSDYAETFLMDRENAKLAIGYHHHSVRDALSDSLASLGTVKLDGQDNPQRKDWIAHKYFQGAPEQIMLLGMMAAKEGLELPYIDTALVIEREWSSAEEEQFEFRFYNPDKDYLEAKGLNREKVTTVEYILAVGTIDWFFYELIEEKRKIFGETIGNNWSIETDSSSWKDLLDRTMGARL
jgi:SNF2 family DNA or RNA helicase